jgi:tetraacyldisaccharide 4'-kinase
MHSRAGPVPGVLGRLLSIPYGLEVGRRNRRFDAGKGVIRFDRPVISVGNLSVGGTGKTPMVEMVLRWLLDAGHRPVVAMRGYALGDGESDEAAAYRREFPHVPVVARADRVAGLIERFGREIREELEPSDVIVLDDGFQHRRIARDADLVLIDATRSPFDDRLLPAGWLREPVRSLGRATHTVITHAESPSADAIGTENAVLEHTGRAPDAVTRHAWAGLTLVAGDRERHEAVDFLNGKRTLAVCAIGNPAPFLDAAASHSDLAARVVLRDHDPYRPATIQRIAREAEAADAQLILTTEKDWSKLLRLAPDTWPCPIARPTLALSFDRGETELRNSILATVAAGAPA